MTDAEWNDEEWTANCGFQAFDDADLLAVILDRSASEWSREEAVCVMRARNIIRAALVSVVALVGHGKRPFAEWLVRAFEQSSEGRALRVALRRCENVPERDLLALYNRAMREVG